MRFKEPAAPYRLTSTARPPNDRPVWASVNEWRTASPKVVVLSLPPFFVPFAVELGPATEAALRSLFFATGLGAYFGGMVGATLEHLDDEHQPPPRRVGTANGE